MKYIVNLIRIALGALFIFSGVIKMNDPMGFGYKLEEYFAELRAEDEDGPSWEDEEVEEECEEGHDYY